MKRYPIFVMLNCSFLKENSTKMITECLKIYFPSTKECITTHINIYMHVKHLHFVCRAMLFCLIFVCKHNVVGLCTTV